MTASAAVAGLALSWTARAAVRLARPEHIHAHTRLLETTGCQAALQPGTAGALTVVMTVQAASTTQACQVAMDRLAHHVLPLLPGAHLADLRLTPGAALTDTTPGAPAPQHELAPHAHTGRIAAAGAA